MKNTMLIRFGDLVLKGKNRNIFTSQVKRLIKEKLKDLDVSYEYDYNHVLVNFNIEDFKKVKDRLMLVTGIHSFSLVYRTLPDIKMIAELAIKIIREEIVDKTTFKVETKRIDKSFPKTSIEISQSIAKLILPKISDLVE